MDVAGLCKAEVDAEAAKRVASKAKEKEEKRKAARKRIAEERRRAREERKRAREEEKERDLQKTLALSKVIESADLALQQAAKAAEGKPLRKLPSGATPERPVVRRKRRGQGGGARSSGAPSPVQQLGSSFDAAAQGMTHADASPEPEESAEPLTPRSEGPQGEDAGADGGPGGSGSKKTTPLRELQREKKAQAKWKPGGEFGPRSHPFLKESPRYTAQVRLIPF